MIRKGRAMFFRVFFAFFLCFGLWACAPLMNETNGKPLPQITFSHLSPLELNVEQVNIDELNMPDTPLPSGFVFDPASMAQSYLESRFHAVGVRGGALYARVKSMSLTHEYIPSEYKVTNFLGVEGVDRYRVDLEITLEHRNSSGRVVYGNTLAAKRTMNISEHVSLAERERHEMEGLEAMFHEIDIEVKKIILQDMSLGRF